MSGGGGVRNPIFLTLFMVSFGKRFLSPKLVTILLLCGIVGSGFFLRFVHFDEWLYFKLDQSRDAMLLSRAVEEGPRYLPLLGPRVGAVTLSEGLLRTGPAYYYLQYLSGTLSRSVEPPVFAYPDLFFGTASLVILFFFSRLFFRRSTSLLVVALLSGSFLAIQYSRFAWNPNPLPFFLMVSFFGLLRFLHAPSGWKRYGFLLIFFVGFSGAAQLHYFGMMSLLGIITLFLGWHFALWKPDSWRRIFSRSAFRSALPVFGMGFLILLFFFSPMIISDVMRDGQNTRNFFEALIAKQDAKPLTNRLEEAFFETPRYLCLLSTGFCLKEGEPENIPPLLLTLLLLGAGGGIAFQRLRGMSEGIRKDFLRLLLVWIVVFCALSIPVAFQLRPRFFLVVLPIPFLFFGLVFEFLRERWNASGLVFGTLLFILLLTMNLFGVSKWFLEQAAAQRGDAPVSRTLILKTKDGVTLGQLRRAAHFMKTRLLPEERLYFYVKPEHIAPIEYLLRLSAKQQPELVFRNMQKVPTDPKARFFAILATGRDPEVSLREKFGQPVTIRDAQSVGQITVFEIDFPQRMIDPAFEWLNAAPLESSALLLDEKRKSSDRVFWGEAVSRFLNRNEKTPPSHDPSFPEGTEEDLSNETSEVNTP